MLHHQPVLSLPKLVFKNLKRRKSTIETSIDFSVLIESQYCSSNLLTGFTEIFDKPEAVPSFSFIVSFRATMQCLAQSSIPSNLLGLIHISNYTKVHKQPNWLLPYDIKVTIVDARTTEKGHLYNVETEISQFNEVKIVSVNEMLDKKAGYKNSRDNHKDNNNEESLRTLESYKIKQKTALRYAMISKDFNPIHLSNFTAKLFSMKKSLIHGMYNVHKTICLVNEQQDLEITEYKVNFNKPCFIPNKVYLKQYDNDEFGLFDESGSMRFLKLSVLACK